jgi:hypothetical protein
MTPCHDELGAITCVDEGCSHANTFCGDCRVPLTECSACGAVCHGERQETRSKRDGSVSEGTENVHGGEHVCRECEAPFCWEHFVVVNAAEDADAPERDGYCVSCHERREGEMR